MIKMLSCRDDRESNLSLFSSLKQSAVLSCSPCLALFFETKNYYSYLLVGQAHGKVQLLYIYSTTEHERSVVTRKKGECRRCWSSWSDRARLAITCWMEATHHTIYLPGYQGVKCRSAEKEGVKCRSAEKDVEHILELPSVMADRCGDEMQHSHTVEYQVINFPG